MVKHRTNRLIVTTLLFACLIPALGYAYLGSLYAGLFAAGYVGGWVLWLIVPSRARWVDLRVAYWLTMLAFLLLHKVEENRTDFFAVVSANITGTPVPEVTAPLVISLLVVPVGAWLAVPPLLKRGYEAGYFVAWTFFASMGITELAHFVLPILANEPYGYFPGMASVFVLAPLAWWGMWRLARTSRSAASTRSGEA
jgi:hypothetical protein